MLVFSACQQASRTDWMTLSALLPLLSESERFQDLMDRLREPVSHEALIAPGAPTPYVVGARGRAFGAPVVVVTPQPEGARRLADPCFTLLGGDAPV